jgi:mRNA-degrading endonuclease RelE of RelBE toxin-antitoxin system
MIEESEIFIKQVIQLRKKYSKIEEDVRDLKIELPKLAFKHIAPLNIHIVTVEKADNFCKKVWRIRVLNSNNNKGKSSGYRVFYCEGKNDDSVLLLGIYSKPNIKDNEYQKIGKELVAASCIG